MNYYEEFGLTPDASADEIRVSYRLITQVLHPDRYLDQPVKALVELQMKRINGIASTLLNVERRREYDKSLSDRTSSSQSAAAFAAGWVRENPIWVLLGVLGVATLFLTEIQSPREASNLAEVSRTRDVPPTVPKAINSKRYAVQMAEKAQRATEKHISPAHAATAKQPWALPKEFPSAVSTEAVDVLSSEQIGMRETAVNADPPFPRAAGTAQNTEPASIIGRWIFTPNPKDPTEGGYYRAEYVDLSLSLSADAVHGNYYARYRVLDRALNPIVEFRFDGKLSQNSFTWRGDSGSIGKITLALESPNTLKVRWVASSMGNTLSLGSGEAVVYRFR